MGEARLWYETLGAVQLDWNALQDHFQQQYSKFGNTREQYFHAWRSFQYDENTDTIDSYIHKVKQVAALLNYGELQILELFKNTLLSKIYYMLYHINDLREAVEIAKRMQTKEQIDKQKSGQSSVSSFMKINQQNSKRNKKNVSFSTMETIQKQGDSIDKLTSLMNDLSTKLDRRENSAQYKPKNFQGRNRGCEERQNRCGYTDRSYNREQGLYNGGRSRRSNQNSNNYSVRNYRHRNNNNGEYSNTQ